MLKYDRATIAEYIQKADANVKLSKKESAVYLGVDVAEMVFSKMFKQSRKMKYGHKGFDFICPDGYTVDIKSATIHIAIQKAWAFNTKHNKIADYFFCVAFNNNKDLQIKHIWMIPAKQVIQNLSTLIRETNLQKWEKYECVNLVDKANDIICRWKEDSTEQSVLQI